MNYIEPCAKLVICPSFLFLLLFIYRSQTVLQKKWASYILVLQERKWRHRAEITFPNPPRAVPDLRIDLGSESLPMLNSVDHTASLSDLSHMFYVHLFCFQKHILFVFLQSLLLQKPCKKKNTVFSIYQVSGENIFSALCSKQQKEIPNTF